MIRLRPDLCLAGSPERTVWRSVVETHDNRLFVLEKIPSRRYARKRRIAGILQWLADHKLAEVLSYRQDTDGEAISLFDHGLWQLCPYVEGVPLDRPAYAMDEWRGNAAAAFLTRFYHICLQNPAHSVILPFSIVDYIRNLFATLSHRQPTIAERYHPFTAHLERHLLPVHDGLPRHFCHGDLHPLNIIWGKDAIRAVIDWEFCGIKPEIYDLANLLGCLGMEDPRSLAGPFANRLIARLKGSGIYADASWNALPDLMLAIRFAWLGEWLRKDDRPMTRLEADYMSLLLDNRRELSDRWCLSR
ncbi:MAG: aminoglycoside phosphotransferase family protein [Desulfosarcina sp.]